MKNIILLAVVLMTSVSSFAEGIVCKAGGNTLGIQSLVAHNDLTPSGSKLIIIDSIRMKNTDGSVQVLKSVTSEGSIETEFQIYEKPLYNGPFGIKYVSVLKSDNGYALKTKTYCNFYYQEETCEEGDLIDESIDSDLQCSVSN